MGNPGCPGKARLGNDACHCLLLLGTLVSRENFCRMLLLVGSCWWGILVGQEKLGWGKTLVVACCCWETWLARKTSAQYCSGLVAAGAESWLARKTRLGKVSCRCLLLLGTSDSPENFCTILLWAGGCWRGILVGQEKLGWGKTLVVACCCWETWLARKTAAQCVRWFVAAYGESWLARKT